MAENLRQRGDQSLHLPSSDDDPESGDSDHGAGPCPWPIVFRFEDIIFFLVFLKIFLPFLYHMRKSEALYIGITLAESHFCYHLMEGMC
ncbi:hypothetical protein IHE45_20G040400 [Dioscorea alata]|uniref:Uncharacterized protein n=1 Tax=Dioscorea alata TaxID=55571 RepID=A0ACB7TR27_DIOAL|nr:hypothetical protein IHE45_20G040400 [Dioscorea alata]